MSNTFKKYKEIKTYLKNETAFYLELERGASARRDWLQYFEFQAVREAKQKRLNTYLKPDIERRCLK